MEEEKGSSGTEPCLPDSEDHSGEADGSVQGPGGEKDAVKPGEDEPRRSRLKIFNKVMEKSLQRLAADISFRRFAHYFHPLCKQNPQMAEIIHKQFLSDLQKAIQDDLSNVIAEGNLEVKLEELDKLDELAKDNPKPAWRPSGIPEQDVSSVFIPYHQGQEEYVRRELKKLRKENAALAERVKAGRDGVLHTEQCIAAAVEEWKVSVADFQLFVQSLCPSETFDAL